MSLSGPSGLSSFYSLSGLSSLSGLPCLSLSGLSGMSGLSGLSSLFILSILTELTGLSLHKTGISPWVVRGSEHETLLCLHERYQHREYSMLDLPTFVLPFTPLTSASMAAY